MPGKKPSKSSRPGRPQAAPPALLGTDEPYEGFPVVNEVRSGTGVALWLTLRNLMLWSATQEDLRPRLFSESAFRRMVLRLESATPPAYVKEHLLLLSRVLIADAGVTEAELVQAALRVSG